MTDLETVGLEAVFDQADLLGADPLLQRVRNDEAGRGRPDVADVPIGEIAALMHVAAGDQPQIDLPNISTSRARSGIGT